MRLIYVCFALGVSLVWNLKEKFEKIEKGKGVASYIRDYDQTWATKYPIAKVNNNPHVFHCTPCVKTLPCKNQGLSYMNNYMEKYFSKYLCGFRKGHSPQHCLTVMVEKNVLITRGLQQLC